MTLRNRGENAASGTGCWAPPFELAQSQDLAFGEAILRIEAAVRLGIDPSLGPVRALLAELGHPERAFRCVQVAGTNGKTSTSRYTAALLHAAGYSCGLYTSPHLVSYTERVEIDGVSVDERTFARGVSLALAAWERMRARGDAACSGGCTEFELLTAAGFAMFAEAGVDVAVLEVGLGGRWDATSAADPGVVAVTGIGLDHTRLLGDTLEAIAAEKAAVIQPGRAVVLGTNAVRPQGVLDVMLGSCSASDVVPTVVCARAPHGEVPDDVVARDADDSGEPGGGVDLARAPHETRDFPKASFDVLRWPNGLGSILAIDVDVDARVGDHDVHASYPGIELVAPAYQAQNVACALALATAFVGGQIDPSVARAALRGCPVPGRFELLREDPPVIIDACHNPQSAYAFAQAVVEAEPDRSRRPALLIGALADKDHRGIVETIVPLFDRVYVTCSTSPRAIPAAELADEIRSACGVEPAGVFDDVESAVSALYGESFVGCGTITLIGDIAALFQRLLVN